MQSSPSKAPGLANGINSLTASPPPVTDVGDSILIPDPGHYSIGILQSYWDKVEDQFLNVQYEISCISKVLSRLWQREFGDITSVSPDMAGDNYPGSNTQVEMSPAQDMSCAEHLDSPGDVQQTGTAYADSPSEAVIASGMSLPTVPHSTAITKSNSTSIVLTKESVCVPCSPITLAASQFKNDEVQTLTQCGSSLDGSGNQMLQPLSSSPTHCVDLDKTLVPVECKCTLSHSCHMGFDPGGHHDCVSRKEHASLLHQVEVLEKALQHQTAQGHNSLLPCHGSHYSPSDVEDNKTKDSVLGSVPEYSPDHCPSLEQISMAILQGDSGYKSPVDSVNMSTEVGSSATVFEPDREVLSCQSPVLSKDVNSGVSHSADQFHKTSTPKSPKVYLALTELSISDCHQSPTRQLHFDSLQPGLPSPLSVVGHSPTNALDKNDGIKAPDGDPDLSNDLGPGALPSRVPNDDPQANSSLCEYPGPSYTLGPA